MLIAGLATIDQPEPWHAVRVQDGGMARNGAESQAMARPRIPEDFKKRTVGLTLDPVVVAKAQRYCRDRGISLSSLVERLLRRQIKLPVDD